MSSRHGLREVWKRRRQFGWVRVGNTQGGEETHTEFYIPTWRKVGTSDINFRGRITAGSDKWRKGKVGRGERI